MSASADRLSSSLSTAGYTDGLGRRSIRFDREVGGMLECLRLRPELALYEPLLREAAARLAAVHDDRIAQVTGIHREPQGLVVVSELAPGQRLVDLLEARSSDEFAGPGIDAGLAFLVQAIAAVDVLHTAGLVHGSLGPGHIGLTPAGDVVLLDCIYASAVERLELTGRALWTRLAVATGATPVARLDRTTDLHQLSLCALAISLGRPLQEAFRPEIVAGVIQDVTEVAQIRAGDRFAEDFRRLLTGQSETARDTASMLREAHRLADVLGMDTCRAALTDLSRIQSYPEPMSAMVARAAALHLVIPPEPVLDPPIELALDLPETVEIPLDRLNEPDIINLTLPEIATDVRDSDPAIFDWQPEPVAPPDQSHHDAVAIQPEPAAAAPVAAIEANPIDPADAVVAPPPPVGDPAPPPEVPAQVAPAAPQAVPPATPSRQKERSRNRRKNRRKQAGAPQSAPAPVVSAPPPAPVRIAAPTLPLPAPQHSEAPPLPPPRPIEPFVPAPLPSAFRPVPPPAPLNASIGLAPGPSPVVVAGPAQPVVPAAPLRIKTEGPAGYTRPRRILSDAESDEPAQSLPFVGRGSRSPGAFGRPIIVAAAVVVLAIAGFVGRPLFNSEPSTPAAAAPVAPPPAAPAPSDVGGLNIETQPAGAAVLLDGEDVGRTPLKLESVKPGRHVVTLTTDSTSVRRTVRIEAGKVVSLDIAVYSGWVAVYSPVTLHISEGGRSLGTTESTRVMLSPGRHDLTFTSRELSYTSRQTVEIVPGEERVLNIDPKGTVSVNAVPWAEVWVDGVRMGETPLANLEVALGTREFLFKHPTFGERRITTRITGQAPPISVDFTKPGTNP